MVLWEFCHDVTGSKDLLRHPVFVRFLTFVFLGGEGSLFVTDGDNSRGLKSSAGAPSGTIATESILIDSMSKKSAKVGGSPLFRYDVSAFDFRNQGFLTLSSDCWNSE